jgi:hypothetical protein
MAREHENAVTSWQVTANNQCGVEHEIVARAMFISNNLLLIEDSIHWRQRRGPLGSLDVCRYLERMESMTTK